MFITPHHSAGSGDGSGPGSGPAGAGAAGAAAASGLPIPVVHTSMGVVIEKLEAVEQQMRVLESERVRLFAEAADIAVLDAEPATPGPVSGVRAEMSFRAVRAEIAAALHVSEWTVGRQMDQAQTLTEEYPRLRDALEDGLLAAQHASIVVEAGVVIGKRGDLGAVLRRAAYEEAVLPFAQTETPGRLRPIARALAEQFAEISLDERYEDARKKRRVTVTAHDDGMADLNAYLPAAEAYAIFDRLTRMSRMEDAGGAGGDAGGEPGGAGSEPGGRGDPAAAAGDASDDGDPVVPEKRSRDEVRADLFTELLLHGTPEAPDASDAALARAARLGKVRAQVQLVIPVAALDLPTPAPPSAAEPQPPPPTPAPTQPAPPPTASPPDSDRDAWWSDTDMLREVMHPPPATLAGYGPIPQRSARVLAESKAAWDVTRVDQDTGALLSVERYRPSKRIRRYLRVRDQRCRFPGCAVPAIRCDIDHTVDAALGGATSTTNLSTACKGHHTLKHASGWHVTQPVEGTLEWCSPAGRVYREKPPSRVMFVPVNPKPSAWPSNDMTGSDSPSGDAGPHPF